MVVRRVLESDDWCEQPCRRRSSARDSLIPPPAEQRAQVSAPWSAPCAPVVACSLDVNSSSTGLLELGIPMGYAAYRPAVLYSVARFLEHQEPSLRRVGGGGARNYVGHYHIKVYSI